MQLLKLLKKIPIDFAQESMSKKTKGKEIALSFIEDNKLGDERYIALDVGCRDGYYSEILKNKLYNVVSIDVDKKYEHCVIIDINKKINYKNNYFKVVWCSEVLEHLKNPNFSINEMRRVLQYQGQLILTTPNSYFWFYHIMKLFNLTPQKLQRDDHLHYFNYKQIRNLFPNAKIYGYFPYFFLRFKISKLIGFLSPTFIIHEVKE